ncbi:hypothetical protein ACFLXT_00895 [Chloroflexota bacterium]
MIYSQKLVSIEAGMSRWEAVLRLVGVGFYIGGSILLDVLAGSWLDSKYIVDLSG